MRYLLDTCTLLWFFNDSSELPALIAETIENPNAKKLISIASLWEFTIKRGLGKLDFEGGIEAFGRMLSANKIAILPINESYLIILEQLPLLHRDPFDRILVATAIAEGMTILTADTNIRQYDVMWSWNT